MYVSFTMHNIYSLMDQIVLQRGLLAVKVLTS